MTIWKTKEGKEIAISDMTTDHIKSVIDLLVKRNGNNPLGVLNKLEPFYKELEKRT